MDRHRRAGVIATCASQTGDVPSHGLWRARARRARIRSSAPGTVGAAFSCNGDHGGPRQNRYRYCYQQPDEATLRMVVEFTPPTP